MIRITIQSDDENRTLEYDGSRALSIGRSPRSDIVLTDERASRSHCEIRPGDEPGEPCYLLDLKSRNGTLLNDRTVDRSPLREGDEILVGSTRIRFGEPSEAAAAPGGVDPAAITEEAAGAAPVPATEEYDAGADSFPPAPASLIPEAILPGTGFGMGFPGSRILWIGGGAALAGLLLLLAALWLLPSRTPGPPPEPPRVATGGEPSEPLPGVSLAPAVSRQSRDDESVQSSTPDPSAAGRQPPAASLLEPSGLEDEAWRLLHLEHSGEGLLEAYLDFAERFPAAPRAAEARAVVTALQEMRSGDASRFYRSVTESARDLGADGRFAEERALLAAASRIADREGEFEAAGRLKDELERAGRRAEDLLSRRRSEASGTIEAGRTAEAFRDLVGLSPKLGDLPAFASALLEFERAFGAAEAVQRQALGAAAVQCIRRAREAFAACRFRAAQAEYLLALSSDLAMAAEERASLWRKASDAGLIARTFEAAVPQLAEKKPQLDGLSVYPAKVAGATPESIEYDVLVEGGQPVRFQLPWVELRDAAKLRIFSSVTLSGEALLGLASFAWELGDDAAAEAALLRLKKGSSRWEGQIQAAIAIHREVPVPEGGFVVYQERFVDPVEKARREKESQLARERAEAAARELAAARRDQKLDRFITIAASLREDGHFEAAEGIYRAIAERFARTSLGEKAGRRLQDPVLRLRRLRESDAPEKPANRITIYFLAEGYPVKDDYQAGFDVVARRAWNLLIKEEPYREYSGYFDAAAVNVGSRDTGVDRMPGDVKRETALGGKVEWDTFTSDRDAVERILVSIGSRGPHQAVVIGNDYAGVSTGGGGVSSIVKTTLSALPHEVGHALGGLHDEYDTPAGNDPQRKLVKKRAGNVPARPMPPNLAAGSSREEVMKVVPWRHWIEAGESSWWNRSKVEVFEGGNYSPVEVWRPQSECIMRHGGTFCVVCMETMMKAIYRRVRPIDDAEPAAGALTQPTGAPLVLEAFVLKPRTHFLEAKWNADLQAAEPPLAGPRKPGLTNVPKPAASPQKPSFRGAQSYRRIAPGGRVVEGLRIPGEDLGAPGVYLFTLEVRDPTPWVLKDEEGLLRQSRSWTVTVREASIRERPATRSGGSDSATGGGRSLDRPDSKK